MKKKILTFDVETTTHNYGHFADKRNSLVLSGFKWLGEPPFHFPHNHCSLDYQDHREKIQTVKNEASCLVGFNIKFDLHWMKNLGINLDNISVWDCQLAEFILSSQTLKPNKNSLNEALTRHSLPLKLDVVKTEFWDKGIDTYDIPMDVLVPYLDQDLIATESLFKIQRQQFMDML